MAATTSRSQHFVITNYRPKVVHPGRISSPDSPLRYSLYLSVFYVVLQTLQLHLVPFPCLIIILSGSRFSKDFIWYGKLFQTLGPKTLKLLLPKMIWLCTCIFKFNIYFSRTSLLVFLKLKRSLIKSGLRLLIVFTDFSTRYS